MDTYNRNPVTFVKGQGVWLWDDKGEKYLDALAGIAVNGLGHAHPKLVKAISEQAAKLIHVSNVYQVAEQAALADKLAEVSGMDKVFFCNSGCEANEAAISWRGFMDTKKALRILKLSSWSAAFMAAPWPRFLPREIARRRQVLSH